MLTSTQAISNPLGVTVFGSAILRVPPNRVSMEVAVTVTRDQPKEAFAAAREGATSVSAYLREAKVTDVRSSRVTLDAAYDYAKGERHFRGYRAKIQFHILLEDLDRMEQILTGVIDAGANEVGDVTFTTTKLKSYRAEARREAVGAARDKALAYADAAGQRLGRVLHIEDVNPQSLASGHGEGHQLRGLEPEEASGAIDPGAIAVGGAVRIAYAFA